SLATDSSGLSLQAAFEFRNLLVRLLRSGGQVIAIVDDPVTPIRLGTSNAQLATVCLPVQVNATAERGTSLSRNQDHVAFARYLDRLTGWKFHFTFAGVIGLVGHVPTAPVAYLTNREGLMLAGALHIAQGRCVVLPNGPFDPASEAIDLLLAELTGSAPEI